jgi:hypothetical protein
MSESDPKTPPHEEPSIIPGPDAQTTLVSAGLKAVADSETDDTETVDAAMGAAAEPAPIDPTSEDLEDTELDDTEDRD